MTWRDQRTGKKLGSTTAWRRTRARILVRDGHRCRIRGPECTDVATTVHHVLGRGVSERDQDLLSACAKCNNDEGDPTANADPRPKPVTSW